jgi:hypothetical protein
MRENRDALAITVIGGLLVTVGGGVILSDVLPSDGDGSSQPVVVHAPPPSAPTVITVKVPTPPAPKVVADPPPPAPKPPPAQPTPSPVAAQQPTSAPPPPATPPPPSPPPPSPSPSPPTETVRVVTTSAGTVVPEGMRAELLDGRLTVAVGKAADGTIGRVGLRAAGRTCAFARVRPGDILGLRVTRRGAVGVRVVAVSAKGATVKAAASRVPRTAQLCLRATSSTAG